MEKEEQIKELKAKLDKLGVKYHHRAGIQKLTELLEEATKKIVEPQEEKTIEEFKEEVGIHKEEGEIKTKSGIVIPPEATGDWEKPKWEYVYSCTEETCKVYRLLGEKEEFIREYTKDIHGDKFKELAEQFVNKNNK